MRPRTFSIADSFRSEATKRGNQRQRRIGAGSASSAVRPLLVSFVVLAVFASSLVFASPTSAHESSAHGADPTYSCEAIDGELNPNTNMCEKTVPADEELSCSTGTLNEETNECETDTGAVPFCSPPATPDNGSCTHVVGPTYSCSEGNLNVAANECVTATAATYDCPAEFPPPSAGLCIRYTSPGYTCPSGVEPVGDQCLTPSPAVADCGTAAFDGAQCVHTGDPIYSCPSGSELDGAQCITRTPASYDCPSGFPPPSAGLCIRYIAATPSCASGYSLSGGQCTHTVAVTYSCAAGTLSGNQCVHSANLVYSCSSGFTLSGGRCTKTTAASSDCPAGFPPPSAGLCIRYIAATPSCASGYSLSGGQCTHTVAVTYSCAAGTLSGNQCVHTANLVYSCSSGSLSGTQCLHTSAPIYSCSSGTLSGTQCVTTHEPVCTLDNDFVTCDTPGADFHCSPGFTLSSGTCTKTTPATASCPAGYQTGAFGICYKYTTASSDCPSGFPPPSGGLCIRYTAATPSCAQGYTLSGGQCTHTVAATYSCAAGTLSGSQCVHTADLVYTCESGYTLSGTQCTKTIPASSDCPAGFPPPSAGLCIRYTSATPSCASGYSLSGGQCTHTVAVTYSCASGTLSGNQCVHTASPVYTCVTGTLSGTECTTITAAITDCPAEFPPPSAGLCIRYTAPDYTCPAATEPDGARCITKTPADPDCGTAALDGAQCVHTANPGYRCPDGPPTNNNRCVTTTPANPDCPDNYQLTPSGQCSLTADPTCTNGDPSGNRCVTTTPATLTYTCTSGMLSGTQCVKTTQATLTCPQGTPNGQTCDHNHEPEGCHPAGGCPQPPCGPPNSPNHCPPPSFTPEQDVECFEYFMNSWDFGTNGFPDDMNCRDDIGIMRQAWIDFHGSGWCNSKSCKEFVGKVDNVFTETVPNSFITAGEKIWRGMEITDEKLDDAVEWFNKNTICSEIGQTWGAYLSGAIGGFMGAMAAVRDRDPANAPARAQLGFEQGYSLYQFLDGIADILEVCPLNEEYSGSSLHAQDSSTRTLISIAEACRLKESEIGLVNDMLGCDEYTPAIVLVSFTEVTHDEATVTVAVRDADSGTRVWARWRKGTAAWNVLADQDASSGSAEFTVTGLDASSMYEVQASLDSDYSSFTTATAITRKGPVISSVSFPGITYDGSVLSAEARVAVSDAGSGTRVWARWRKGTAAWNVLADQDASSGSAEFTLAAINFSTKYEMELSLYSDYSSSISVFLTIGG